MKPIYCIEEYEYFNPYGSHAADHDHIYFLIIFSCREGTVQFRYHLSEMVDACKKHEPRLYRYLQNLLADIEEFYNSDTRLIRALEQDGFDISRLLYVLFDNADLEHIANWIKKHGKNQERRTVYEIQSSMTKDEDMLDFGEQLATRKKVARKVYKAIKELALDYLPTFNLLETELMRSFNTCLNNYAVVMVDMAVSKLEQLEQMGIEAEYDEDDENNLTTLAGRRRFYLDYRKKSPVKGCEESPIFCVEIVEFVEEWESRGCNRVSVWYKLTCAEGEWYNDINFECLIQEAMLYFPDIYADAMECYRASSSPRPRHPAMLRGLRRMGHDLTPVLASYLANERDFLPNLREEMRMKSIFPDYQNDYVERRKSEEEELDPVGVEEFRLINFLRDDLVSECIAGILGALPEFQIRAPQSFLDYMEHWAYHVYIDPINDLNKELERAFELRRGINERIDNASL